MPQPGVENGMPTRVPRGNCHPPASPGVTREHASTVRKSATVKPLREDKIELTSNPCQFDTGVKMECEEREHTNTAMAIPLHARGEERDPNGESIATWHYPARGDGKNQLPIWINESECQPPGLSQGWKRDPKNRDIRPDKPSIPLLRQG